MTRLVDLTWPDVEQLPADTVLAVPVGSTEQHGRHLPLSTDTDIARALCRQLAQRRRGIVVAPAVSYGSSGEHAGFPGTLSIGQAATELLLVELGRSASESFAHLLFVSAHGGNAGPVSRAVARLRAESRDARAFMPSWDGDAHAGRIETSLMLATRPLSVRAGQAVAGNTAALADLMPQLRAGGVRAVSETGVLGDPAGADAAEGAALLGDLADALDREVTAWLGPLAA
jgi:creatinine amidohydrolase